MLSDKFDPLTSMWSELQKIMPKECWFYCLGCQITATVSTNTATLNEPWICRSSPTLQPQRESLL